MRETYGDPAQQKKFYAVEILNLHSNYILMLIVLSHTRETYGDPAQHKISNAVTIFNLHR